MERDFNEKTFMKKINIMNKIKKWKNQIILVMICIVLGFAVVGFYKKSKELNYEVKKLNDEIEKLKKTQMSADTIREELKEISKYSAYEVNYTSILFFSDKNKTKFFSIGIPFTETQYVATIEGTMSIGIDGELVSFSEKKNKDGKIKKVIITIPHSSILFNSTDSSTLKEYEYDKGIGNPIEPKESNELRIKAEENEKARVLKSDILEKCDERIEYLLKSHFRAVYGEGVNIEIEYL